MRRAWLLALCAAGCSPDLGAPPSLVASTRLLALRGDPAEAPPGAMVAFTSLVGAPTGTMAAPGIVWSFCLDPKPLADNNAASVSCFGDALAAGGPAPSLTTALPAMGCAIFGPEAPPVKPGMSPLRPRDPDVTGGFYQPLMVDLPAAGNGGADLLGVALERIACDLANAPIEVVQEFATRYHANANPALAGVLGAVGGDALAPLVPEGATAQSGMVASVPVGARVTFEARFADGAAETYPVYDAESTSLVDHREALRVSWFATAGVFDHDRTGRGEAETDLFTDDGWIAPAVAATVTLWAVLRDSRGGVDFASYTIIVQ